MRRQGFYFWPPVMHLSQVVMRQSVLSVNCIPTSLRCIIGNCSMIYRWGNIHQITRLSLPLSPASDSVNWTRLDSAGSGVCDI